jgi:hypothetical protein
MTTMRSIFFAAAFAVLIAIAQAGTRPEDLKWLEAKATEPGVTATGSGLLYKGERCVVVMAVYLLLCCLVFLASSHRIY